LHTVRNCSRRLYLKERYRGDQVIIGAAARKGIIGHNIFEIIL